MNRSETATYERKHEIGNMQYRIEAEQSAVLSGAGQYDGEAAPAATSCSLSGKKYLSHRRPPLTSLPLHTQRVRQQLAGVCVCWCECF